MQVPRLLVPTILTAVGFFLLTQGIDSLKVENVGIRLLTVQSFASVATLSYHTVGIICVILGFALMALGAEICRRADQRVVAAIPGLQSPRSFRFVIPVAGFFAFVGWYIVSRWFTTRSI
ncbi:MAG: hypothetical protein ACREFF_07445 [Candidatus Udaeobacter sp.]